MKISLFFSLLTVMTLTTLSANATSVPFCFKNNPITPIATLKNICYFENLEYNFLELINTPQKKKSTGRNSTEFEFSFLINLDAWMISNDLFSWSTTETPFITFEEATSIINRTNIDPTNTNKHTNYLLDSLYNKTINVNKLPQNAKTSIVETTNTIIEFGITSVLKTIILLLTIITFIYGYKIHYYQSQKMR